VYLITQVFIISVIPIQLISINRITGSSIVTFGGDKEGNCLRAAYVLLVFRKKLVLSIICMLDILSLKQHLSWTADDVGYYRFSLITD